jgi:hypothetical protein
MAATLVPEDGTGVSNANTYITLAEYATYIDERGLTDSTTDDARTGRIIQAKDWLESQDKSYQGNKNVEDQALVWPRWGVYIYSYSLGNNEIPQQLKDAQAQLVFDSASTSIYNVNDGQAITKEKVDVLEVEYSDNGVTNVQPIFAKVNALLKPLFKTIGGLGSVIRV